MSEAGVIARAPTGIAACANKVPQLVSSAAARSTTPSAAEVRAKEEPSGSELLLTLLMLASASWRVSTTLNPSPLSSASDARELDELHVARVQTALSHLPRIGPHGFEKALRECGPDVWAAAHSALLASDGRAALHGRTRGGYFRAERRFGARYRVRCCGDVVSTENDTANGKENGKVEVITAFHGSAGENWWAILKGGLQVHAGYAAENGRAFGDAAYLATDFETAAGFARLGRVPPWSPLPISGATVVGEFEVTLGAGVSVGACRNGNSFSAHLQQGRQRERGLERGRESRWQNACIVGDVPNEYVVVWDVSKVRLVALHALVSRKKKSIVDRENVGVRWVAKVGHSLQWGKSMGIGSIAFLILVLSYVGWMYCARQ